MDVLLHRAETAHAALREVAVQDDVVRDVLLFLRHLVVVGRVQKQTELVRGQTVSGIVVELVLALFPGPGVIVFLSVAVAEITEGVVPDVEAERVRDHGRVSVRSRLTVSQRLSDVHLSEIGAGLLGKITGRDRVTKAQVRGDTEVGSVFHTGVLLGGKCRNT